MTFIAIIHEGDKYSREIIHKVRSKQARPYRDPLPYSSYIWDERDSRTRAFSYYHQQRPAGTFVPSYLGILREQFNVGAGVGYLEKNEVWNKALNKIDEELSYISNLFEAWYERREAYSMLGKCLKGILTFAKRWKDPKYWKEMRAATGKTVKDPKSLPQAWLLWNFAIKPLIGTIEDIFNLFSKDMPYFWVEGSSIANATGVYDNRTSQKEGVMVNYDTQYIVKHGVRVSALNPNAALLNTMGMTTPFSTAVSVIPWGWAVNYFINVSELLSNFEVRWPGVELDAGYSTVFVKTKYNGHYGEQTAYDIDPWLPNNGFDKFRNPVEHIGFNGEVTSMTRTIGIPDYKVNLSYPPLGSSSFANLASAIALTMAGADKKK